MSQKDLEKWGRVQDRPPMTPEKAIDILDEWAHDLNTTFDLDFRDAVKLATTTLRAQVTSIPKRGLK